MFDPYRKWLGIPPAEQPPNHYRLLGLSLYESDLDVIKTAVVQRSAYVRNFQAGKQGDDAARVLNEIAAAEACLTNKEKRAVYDADLRRKEAAKKPKAAPPQPAAPSVDPLLEHAAAMTTLSAPWQSPQFAGRAKQTNYLPLAIGGVAVVVVVILGMVLASMMGGDGETIAQREPPADTRGSAPEGTTAVAEAGVSGDDERSATSPAGETTTNATSASQGNAAMASSTETATATTTDTAVAVSAPPPPATAPFNADQARAHQEAWAAHLGVPVEYQNSIGMKFVLIPPGEFTMGSTPEEIEAAMPFAVGQKYLEDCIRSEAPQHKVILTAPIYLGVHEVTQADYEQVMEKNPSHFTGTGPGKDSVAGLDTAVFPVERVIWNDAVEFCATLSEKEQLMPSDLELRAGETVTPLKRPGYRLPTEAQWEFACRAGTTTRYWTGDRDDSLPQAGWFGQNSGGRTHAGGELKANPFGLYDIHGNVWEWVQDSWEATYYRQFQAKPALDPSGPSSGSLRVLRGGHWNGAASPARAANRLALDPGYADHTFGFRAALSVEAVAAVGNHPVESGTEQSPVTADEAMAAIRAAGGTIEAYRHQALPAVKIVMQGPGIDDAVLANVRWLPDTRELFLGGSAVSDAGLTNLIGLDRLEVLGLDDTRITDAGVAHLAEVPSLKIINVGWSSGRAAITDAGAEHLSKLTQLTSLGISHTQLTDEGLKHLAKLKKLEVLFLNGIALSDAAVAELKRKLPKANIVR